MGSVTQSLVRFFRGGPAATNGVPVPAQNHASVRRRSSGLAEFMRSLGRDPGLCILDLGPTSPANITHLTGLGHKVYNEDILLASGERRFIAQGDDGKPGISPALFLRENLAYERELFDGILCWDVPDYLPEVLVKPSVERIHSILKPGGALLAYFHTREAGPDAPHHRYHIVAGDSLELQRGPQFRLQRAFNNRHIENLFRDYSSIKFFLTRDNIREVLVLR
jgi:SAM-dependent methyltransferase